MASGWIKLHRKMLEWEWYKDIPVRILFEHCLLKANKADTKWHGIDIMRGSFITSIETLVFETGLTKMQVRTALKKLKTTREITHQTTRYYSIIIINNWDSFQADNTPSNTQITRQATRQVTTAKEYKKREDKNSNISYINSSSSSIEDLPKISEEEEELLKNHSLKNKVKYFKPWLRKVLANGDYKEILEKEKKRLQRLEEKKKEVVEIKRVELTKEDEEEILKIQQRMREKIRRG